VRPVDRAHDEALFHRLEVAPGTGCPAFGHRPVGADGLTWHRLVEGDDAGQGRVGHAWCGTGRTAEDSHGIIVRKKLWGAVPLAVGVVHTLSANVTTLRIYWPKALTRGLLRFRSGRSRPVRHVVEGAALKVYPAIPTITVRPSSHGETRAVPQ